MQLKIEKNQMEIKEHGDFSFPVHVSEEAINRFDSNSFLWHWHPEIELTWIMSGQIEYRVNDKCYILTEGDGLFANSNALHFGQMKDAQHCDYLSVTFNPRFIYGYENSTLQTKYVEMITANPEWASMKLDKAIDWHQEILDSIRHIYALSKERPYDYELEVHIVLCRIWQLLYGHYSSIPAKRQQSPRNIKRLRDILTFIQSHYSENITLEDIAGSVNICKSECCRFFKKHMHMTLFEYLMYYRIQQSLPLLRQGESVTKAAAAAGFSNPCYYGKIFRRFINCSPSCYRKQTGTPMLPADTDTSRSLHEI